MSSTLRHRKQLEKESDDLDRLIAEKQEKLRKLKELEEAEAPSKKKKGESELDKRLKSAPAQVMDPQLQQLLDSGNKGRKNKRISPQLQSALQDLLALEADILERKKSESSMTDEERSVFKSDVKRWEKASQLLMMEMLVSEVNDRHRPRRGMRRVLLFGFAVVFVALVVAVISRHLFYKPVKSPITY
eukprot:TRINITY_DN4307_c1_g1_i1.p1 TRINITY_DN4307_c1_g1~~TRINITY_DN4307_c1_g1_i1.p1  ORF type:complete len:188 (+),score=37.57 TRINITY_DN4307_c1_g1_i1:25-588(+)